MSKRPHIPSISSADDEVIDAAGVGCMERSNVSESSPDDVLKLSNGQRFKLRTLSDEKDISRTNDDIHHSIKICPVIRSILNTPQIQRLRGLKQLGLAEYTYINVTHTRFEHSLGVAHLAERLCLHLQKRQPQLNITEKDVLCVKIAGLCHDLGHGPFSHVYDGPFKDQVARLFAQQKQQEKEEDVKRVAKRRRVDSENYEEEEMGFDFRKTLPRKWREPPKKWKHEAASLMMVDAVLEHLGMKIDEGNLDGPLRQIGDGIDAQTFGILSDDVDAENNNNRENIFSSRDWIFIKECILGTPLNADSTSFVGRENPNKEFLYDIVANRHSGLDVDKIDYYARDTRRALGSAGKIEVMFVEECFVAWGKCPNPEKCFKCKHLFHDHYHHDLNEAEFTTAKFPPGKEGMHLMLSYPDKMTIKAMEFFKTRFSLHESVYTHKTTQAAELMMCDILTKADPYIKISTKKLPAGQSGNASAVAAGNTDEKNDEHIPPYLPISCAMLHPQSYVKLKDSVIDLIEQSEQPGILPAQRLLARLRKRDMYKCVATQPIRSLDGITIDPDDEVLWDKLCKDLNSIKRDIVEMSGRHGDITQEVEEGGGSAFVKLEEEDILVEARKIHHGMKEHNPVNRIRFLPKREMSFLSNDIPNLPEARQAKEEDYLSHIPRAFLQRTIRLYCRGSSQKAELLRHCFEQWVEDTRNKAKTFFVEDEDNVGSGGAVCCDIAGIEEIEGDEKDIKFPALCSQDTDAMTPVHGNGHYGSVGSPSPHPASASSYRRTRGVAGRLQQSGPSKAIRNILSNLDD